MKRLVASALALGVIAAPAVATSTAAPSKVTKQIGKSTKLAAKTTRAQTPKKQ